MIAPFRQTFPLTPDCLGPLQASVRDWLEQAAIAPPQAFAVEFAIEELVSNLQRHAAPNCDRPIHLELTLAPQPDGLLLRLVDDGPAFNPDAVPSPQVAGLPEERPIGGLGLFLTHRLAAAHVYLRQDCRNCNELCFLSDRADAPAVGSQP
jgi:anti-sigma regulatory factor (Ser/Thr protein kinase)